MFVLVSDHIDITSISLSCLYILRQVQQTLQHSIWKEDYGICHGRQWLWILPTKMRISAQFAVPHLFLIWLVSYNYLFHPCACPHTMVFLLNIVIPMLQIFCMKQLTQVSDWLAFLDPLSHWPIKTDWLTGFNHSWSQHWLDPVAIVSFCNTIHCLLQYAWFTRIQREWDVQYSK